MAFPSFARSRRIAGIIPIAVLAGSVLADAVASMRLPQEFIQQRVRRIQQDLLAHSRYLRESHFTAIHPGDLEFLFDAYDEQFFTGLCRQALAGRGLSFRLAPRMTRPLRRSNEYMRRAKFEGRQIGRAPLQVDRVALLRDRESGKSLGDLAVAYQISKASVCRVIKDAREAVSKGLPPAHFTAVDSKELRPPKSATRGLSLKLWVVEQAISMQPSCLTRISRPGKVEGQYGTLPLRTLH
jgi:hypothetical protein